MNDNRKQGPTRPIRVGAMKKNRNFVPQYIAVLLVLTMFSAASPVLAGDLVNQKLFERRPLLSLSGIPNNVAFAIPHSSFDAEQSPQAPKPTTPASPKRAASPAKKWVGIGLMIVGGLTIAAGAIISDPCEGLNTRYSTCTSNYTVVRTTYLVGGGSMVGVGALLFSKR